MLTSRQLASVNLGVFCWKLQRLPFTIVLYTECEPVFHKILKRKGLNVSHLRREFKMTHSIMSLWCDKNQNILVAPTSFQMISRVAICYYSESLDSELHLWFVYIFFSPASQSKKVRPHGACCSWLDSLMSIIRYLFESFLNCNNTIFT